MATPVESERPQRITHSLDIYSDRPKYGTAFFERKRGLVDTHISPRPGRATWDYLAVNYFPSGVRTPTQVSSSELRRVR